MKRSHMVEMMAANLFEMQTDVAQAVSWEHLVPEEKEYYLTQADRLLTLQNQAGMLPPQVFKFGKQEIGDDRYWEQE